MRLLSCFGLCLLAVIASLSLVGTAKAQSKNDIVAACLEALESGDVKSAGDLVPEISSWKSLFATKTIRDAEDCLSGATGKVWKYFPTKSRFLADEEARAEQDFIDAADERRRRREEDTEKLLCAVIVAEDRVDALEEELSALGAARSAEALSKTEFACNSWYSSNADAALLDPVCNKIFLDFGLPDSEIRFDSRELLLARNELLRARLRLLDLRVMSLERESRQAEVLRCREMLRE